MAYNYEYPYTDPNRHNDDWVLTAINSIKNTLENLVNRISGGIRNPKSLVINGNAYDGSREIRLQIGEGSAEELRELINERMIREVLRLVKVGNDFQVQDYKTGTSLSFNAVKDRISQLSNYVVMVYGNSKLRPQYVSTNELMFIGLDRASSEAKVLRLLMTADRISYETFPLASKSDIPSEDYINGLIDDKILDLDMAVGELEALV